MSFILDALKKSEAERQRQDVPGLLGAGPATPRARFPTWGIWLGLLLGVNLLVLVVVLMRSGTPGAAQATAPTAAGVKARIPPATPVTTAERVSAASGERAPTFSPMDAAPVYAPEIPVPETASAAQSGLANAASAPSPSVPKPDPRLARALYPPENDNEVLPTLNEINLSGNHSIPDLHMDIHVYAAKPAERFVFFNNRKYREGDTLSEGPSVERITRDGVVLRFQGLRFSVPRQ